MTLSIRGTDKNHIELHLINEAPAVLLKIVGIRNSYAAKSVMASIVRYTTNKIFLAFIIPLISPEDYKRISVPMFHLQTHIWIKKVVEGLNVLIERLIPRGLVIEI